MTLDVQTVVTVYHGVTTVMLALPVVLTALLPIAMLIPGAEPQTTLRKLIAKAQVIASFVEKYSVKSKAQKEAAVQSSLPAETPTPLTPPDSKES